MLETELKECREELAELNAALTNMKTYNQNIQTYLEEFSNYDFKGTEFIGTQANQYVSAMKIQMVMLSTSLSLLHQLNCQTIKERKESTLTVIEALKEAIKEQEKEE